MKQAQPRHAIPNVICPRCHKTICNCLLEDPGFLARAVGKQLSRLESGGAVGLTARESDAAIVNQPRLKVEPLSPEEHERRLAAMQLIHGDCRTKLREVATHSVDASFLDPPYPHVVRPYGTLTEKEWHRLMRLVLTELHRIVKPSGSVVVLLQPNKEVVGRMRLWPWDYVSWAGRLSDDWGLVQDCYSFNPSAIPCGGADRNSGMLRTSIKWCVWIGAPGCYRNQEAVLEQPARDPGLRNRDHACRSGQYVNDATFRRALEERGGVVPRNLLTVPVGTPIDQHDHPAVTPYRLAEWWCRYVLPPGGVLLDCFCGSGTTLLAALDNGAGHVIGIEKEASYLEAARCRILHNQR